VIQAIKAISRCDIALILIDAEEGVTEQDAKIAGLALENGTACIIVVNKWDLIEKDNSTIGKYVEKIKDQMKFSTSHRFFRFRANGSACCQIFDAVEIVYSQYTRRVNTADLNRKVRNFWLPTHPAV